MKVEKTTLQGVLVVEPQVFEDQRGFFLESYSKKEFARIGIDSDFVQDNHSCSKDKGVLRGLHFQDPPFDQAKLVRVVKGSVFDVVVDLRRKSKTFKRWEGFVLSAKNFKILFIPIGFAHGFCTLEKNSEVIYKTDNFYHQESEKGFAWNDSDLKIDWPVTDPILSEKDKTLPVFSELNNPF